jgi:phosphoglycerol transferase MdoB-like AlkP superfamily enzyme
MKIRTLLLFRFFLTSVLIGMVAKVIFLLYNGWGRELSVGDCFAILWNGLPLDLSFSGYVSAVMWFILLAGYWISIHRNVFYAYFAVASLLQGIIYIVDTGLFAFWNFKIDATIFNYLDSPVEVMASVSTLYVVVGISCILASIIGIFLLYKRTLSKESAKRLAQLRLNTTKRVIGTFVHIFWGGLLFLAIRGGLGVSTANPGMVYFSDNAFLNSAAVNPAFNLFYSLSKVKDFSERANYFSADELKDKYAALGVSTESKNTKSLLTTNYPNIVLVILEGCGTTFYNTPGVMPNLKALAAEGVEFTNCYANSFRTDRGVVCTLSGFPSYPDVSVMKLTDSKIAGLPSIARSLSREGYDTEFIYGGDINFTNTNGYLLSTGYRRTFSEADFLSEQRNDSKWGVHDEFAFAKTLQHIAEKDSVNPWMLTLLTLSSHEPWEVPYTRILDNPITNAFAYLDHCIGDFIEKFKKLEAWKNSLVIFIPDHGNSHGLAEDIIQVEKNHIPLIMVGGALKGADVIDVVCNQSDLAATLLGQLGINHEDFSMSRDVLSETYTLPFAMNSWSQGIVMSDALGSTVYDLNTDKVSTTLNAPPASHAENIRAYLQQSYTLLSN